ncbi:MAG: hypothetical protein JNL93_20390 [Pelomonas sp.]|nr:hypothetical protein [Roseateles sp.]
MAEPTKKPRIRVAEAVESGVEGLLVFLVRYFRTGWLVVTRPRHGWRRILADRHTPKPAFVLPLTYLSIGLFLLSLMGQVAGLSVLDWIWFVDDLANKVTDALSKEVSLVKVAVQALPGVAVVAAIALLLQVALRRLSMSRRLVSFALSYAIGAQAFAIFAVAFAFVVTATMVGGWVPPGGAFGANLMAIGVYGAIFGGLALAFFGPLAFMLSVLRLRRIWRVSRSTALAVAAIVTATVFGGHVAVLWATTIPTVVMARTAAPTKPDLTVGDGTSALQRQAVTVAFPLLLANRGTKQQGWETSRIEMRLSDGAGRSSDDRCTGDSIKLEIERVLDASGNEVRYVSVAPKETTWVLVRARAELAQSRLQVLNTKRDWDVLAQMTSTDQDVVKVCSVRTVTPLAR